MGYFSYEYKKDETPKAITSKPTFIIKRNGDLIYDLYCKIFSIKKD